jgi:hypothetical protein
MLQLVTLGIHAQLNTMLQIFWRAAYLKKPLADYKVSKTLLPFFFSGATQAVAPQRKHSSQL